MLRRPLRRRAGFSLVEVLVAIFILAAGLLGLFTLFPLGAVQMAKAMRDDRSQQCALQADGKIRELWRQQVVEGTVPADYSFQICVNSMDTGEVGGTLSIPTDQLGKGRASYPVLFDPVGFASYSQLTGKRSRLAAQPALTPVPPSPVPNYQALPRRTLMYTLTPTPTPLPLTYTLPNQRVAALPLAGLADSMEFAPDGTPADRDGIAVTASGGQVFRTWRQNWAAVIQRPDNATRGLADLKILVFDQRVPGRDPSGPSNELTFVVQVTVGSNQVTFPGVTNDTLGLRKGSWIMDGTITNDANGDGTPGDFIRNAQFYQVNSVAEVGGGVLVELVNPILPTRGETSPAIYNAQLYILSDLIDVYDRPQLTPSGYSKQTP